MKPSAEPKSAYLILDGDRLKLEGDVKMKMELDLTDVFHGIWFTLALAGGIALVVILVAAYLWP
jgi:hypothetical protein